MRTTERYVVGADPRNIFEPSTGGGYLGSDPVSTYYIFSTLDSTIFRLRKKSLDVG